MLRRICLEDMKEIDMIKLDKEITNRGKEVIRKLYDDDILVDGTYPSVNRVHAYAKGTKVGFFNRKILPNDKIMFSIDFTYDWKDNVMIYFNIFNGELEYYKYLFNDDDMETDEKVEMMNRIIN